MMHPDRLLRLFLILWVTPLAATTTVCQDISQLHQQGRLAGTFLNPGLPLEKKWNLSLANIGISLYTDGPSINGITSRNAAGERFIDVTKLPANLADNYNIGFLATARTLDIGLKLKQVTIMAGHRFSSVSNVRYTGSLLALAAQGNAAFIGQQLQIGPSLDASAYNEVYLGAQKTINNFTLGVRAKILYGTASLLTEESDMLFTTKSEYYQLELKNNYILRSSGLLRYYDVDDITIDLPSFSFDNFFYNNRGLAIDLGVAFKAGDKLLFSASALDLGSIKWDFFPRKYTSVGTFKYDGLDIIKYLGDTTQIAVADTILQNIKVESGLEPFKTLLNNTFTLGARYAINSSWDANLLYMLRNEFGIRKHYLTISTVKKISFLDLGLQYSISKNNWTSLGFYTSLKAGAFSCFASTENLPGLVKPFGTKRASLMIGASVQF